MFIPPPPPPCLPPPASPHHYHPGLLKFGYLEETGVLVDEAGSGEEASTDEDDEPAALSSFEEEEAEAAEEEGAAALTAPVVARGAQEEPPRRNGRRGPRGDPLDTTIDAIVSEVQLGGTREAAGAGGGRTVEAQQLLAPPRRRAALPCFRPPVPHRPAEDLRNMGMFAMDDAGAGPAPGGDEEQEGGEAGEQRYPEPPPRSYRLADLLRMAGYQEQVRACVCV